MRETNVSKLLSLFTVPALSMVPAPGTIVVLDELSPDICAVIEVPEIPDTLQASQLESEQVSGPEAHRLNYMCKAARREFFDYVKNLDRTIFHKTCEKFCNLKELNDLVRNETCDYAAIVAVAAMFKEAANETIMDEIVRLKSMMA